jgi:catalase
MSTAERFTRTNGAPVTDNTNIMTAGPRGPALLEDVWLATTGLPTECRNGPILSVWR